MLMRIGGSITCLLGVALCVQGAFLWVKYRAILAHPETKGKIIKSRLVSEAESGVEGGMAEIEYEYHVSGVRYTSRQIASEDTGYFADDVVQKYKSNESVTVYYDPANPKDAFLERGNSLMLITPVGMIIGGGVCIVYSIFYGFFGINLANLIFGS